MRSLSLLAFTLFLASCGSSPDLLFCDESTPCANSVETFCDIDKAFPGTGLKNECIAPPSATACNRVEACADTNLHCSDESMGAIGECVPCVDASHCPGVGEVCNMTTNECEALPCTVDAAGDAICEAAAGDAKPYCVEADTCGECRPEMDDCAGNAANAQVCDAENFACRGCQTNNECTLSDLCDTVSTECAAETDLLYVVATGGSDTGTCTRAAPCATIQRAIDVAMGGRNTILVGAGSYPQKLDINNKTVSILGQGMVFVNPDLPLATDFAFVATNSATIDITGITVTSGNLSHNDSGTASCNGSVLSFADSAIIDSNSAGLVSTNCTLTLTQSTVEGNTGIGISSTGGTLTLTQSTVEGNTGIGISSTGGTLTLTQSTVSGNPSGGVKVDDSDYTIVNNFIVENGTLGNSAVGGISVSATNDNLEVLRFNTFADNTSGAPAHALNCIASALIAESNIFMLAPAIGNTATVSGCGATHSLFDTDSMMIVGQDNISADAVFVDADNDNYHTASGSPGINLANPTTPPGTDIDGDIRPQGAGPDMGADEVE